MLRNLTRWYTSLQSRTPFRTIVRSADELLEAALRFDADVVSVDLFDTLVYRRVFEPNDALYLQHDRVESIPGVSSPQHWVRLRKRAEEELAAAAGPAEIQLAAIYNHLEMQLNLDEALTRRLLEAELAVEAELIRPYDDLIAVLKSLHDGGMVIAVVTDTYLPGDFVHSLLGRFLSCDFVLLCSSVTGKTKRSGSAFRNLQSTFPGRRVLHFGDNAHSDVSNARRNGVAALQVCWMRQHRLSATEIRRYVGAVSATRLITPWDGITTPGVNVSLVDELAWRWSWVLADFVLSLRHYARSIAATDIWFTSRATETLFASIGDVPNLFADFRCQYVVASRACIYPLIAESAPVLFEKWLGRKPSEQDVRDGKLARAYYGALVGPEATRIVMVDSGWKGRLQLLLDKAMPSGVEFSGYYFGLEPEAERATVVNSETFVEWRESVLNEALVEALFGFEGPCALGFEKTELGIEPAFQDSLGDRSPAQYCARLRVYLTELLSGHVASGKGGPSPDSQTRVLAVQRMSLYPDLDQMAAFKTWSIATAVDGSDATNIASGGRASAIDKLVGRGVCGNVWPAAAIWTLTKRPRVGRLIQHAIRWRLVAKRLISDASKWCARRYGQAASGMTWTGSRIGKLL